MQITRITSLGREDYRIIGDYHKEHIVYNFPDSLYKETLFRAQLKKELKNSHAYLFFARGEQKEIVGFLWLRVETDPYKAAKRYRYVDLHYLHVDPQARKKGIGSALMKFTGEFAAKKYCKEIRLGTHVANRHARSLYKKFGFEEYRIIMRKLL